MLPEKLINRASPGELHVKEFSHFSFFHGQNTHIIKLDQEFRAMFFQFKYLRAGELHDPFQIHHEKRAQIRPARLLPSPHQHHADDIHRLYPHDLHVTSRVHQGVVHDHLLPSYPSEEREIVVA